MRRVIVILLIPLLLTAIALKAGAQSCDGSLGDPVINQNFGSGPNPGPPLPAGVTTMTYTANSCPDDGYYTIVNNLSGSANCHPTTWHDVPTDHTGNPNGYMMVVNASEQPSVFFTQQAPTLCPGTVYQFSAYILNLIRLDASGPGVSEPDITFSVTTTSGQVLAIDSTGTIEPTADAHWNQESLFFTTPDSVTSVIVIMTNNAPGGNGNDLILDDITFRACGPVIDAGFTTITGTSDQPLCQGDNATYTLVAKVVGNNNPSYQWQVNTSGNWVDTTGQNTDSLTVNFVNAVPGTYQYRLGVANGPNINSPACRTYSQPLIVTVYANPIITGLSPTVSVCEGDTLVLSASGGVSYQWLGPNLSQTTLNPVTISNISLADAGKYKVIAFSQYSCSSTDSVIVTVYPMVTASVAVNNVTICAGDSTTLSASGGTVYAWSPGTGLSDSTSASPVASPADTTVYTITVSNSNGCFNTRAVTVNVLKKAVAHAGPNKVIFQGQSVKLGGSEKYGNVYYWTPVTYLNNANLLDPVASPVNDITYMLHVTSTNNCGIDSSSVFVKVYKTITIPNTFSPNNDGINDYWDINALVTYPESVLIVFNRYGTEVFRSIGYSKPWDGKYNGQPLPVGTYYYVLDLKNNTPKISGWVLIVR